MSRRVFLDTPGKNGTRRKHYESLARQLDSMPGVFDKSTSFTEAVETLKADIEYRPPGVLAQVLSVFWDLRHNIEIDCKITFQDIKCYVDLMELTLTPNEVKIIMELDMAYRSEYYKEINNGS